MGTKYLIDSNAIIDFLAGQFPAAGMTKMTRIVDELPNVSVISKIEVLGFAAPPSDDEILKEFFEKALILDLSEEIVDQTIGLRRHHKIKLPDAIIAATALTHDLTLITRNTRDFKGIPGLRIKNYHKI